MFSILYSWVESRASGCIGGIASSVVIAGRFPLVGLLVVC